MSRGLTRTNLKLLAVLVCLLGIMSGCPGRPGTTHDIDRGASTAPSATPASEGKGVSKRVADVKPGTEITSLALSPDTQTLLISIRPNSRTPGTALTRLSSLYLASRPNRRWQLVDHSWSYFFRPVFTPDGKALLYMPETPPESIARRELDSGRTQVVYTAPAGWRVLGGDLSPSGKHMVIATTTEPAGRSDQWKVTLVDLGSTAKQDPRTGAALSLSSPLWSPDSARVVWLETGTDTNATTDLRMLDTSSGSVSPVARDCDGVRRGSWAPDSRRLATFRMGRDREGIYVVDVAHGQLERIVPLGPGELDFGAGCPWSPDGNWIAFATMTHDSGADLFALKVASPATKEVKTVLGPAAGAIESLMWTPHGKLLFVRGGTSVEIVSLQ